MQLLMKQFRQHLFSWRRIWLLVVCLAASTLVPAQNKAVSGRVTDSGGQPLVGASVQVKGTRSGTSTDVNGKFILPVSSDKVTLTISMTGYNTQTVNASVEAAVIVVLREDMKGLDEVVVVAYGKQKKADVIGSVSQISGKELEKAPVMNVTNMLAGRISGVTTLQQSGRPGADDATIRIRGVGTYGKASPLIIIDNVQRPSFSYLDPSEIESITVLKDAVSTAVYGLQAANGIILITTKHGKNHKPVITYNGAQLQ
jgi:TonB-dependent SusC/RagA subfamily outer membrane receptor